MSNSSIYQGGLGMIILPWRSPKLPFDVSERMGCKIRIETARFDAIPDDCILHVCRELQIVNRNAQWRGKILPPPTA
jgi:hypothetical protein